MKKLLYFIQMPTALMLGYLDVLAGAALLRRRSVPSIAPRCRFAVLVPAHNEQTLLPRLLRNIASVTYPSDLRDVFVVADNCADRTATVARELGAVVFERRDEDHRGKGPALRWLLSQVRKTGERYDAFVVLDADSTISENFLDVMNAHLVAGDTVIQGYYGVLNPGESWSSAVRYASMALFNDLRPRGRDALGLSAGLRGNGMCFAAEILETYGWESFGLAEDVEFHLTLVEAGHRVVYGPDARVLADMPVSLKQAETQNIRWERGRLQMLQSFGPRLLGKALRQRNPAMIEAVTEQLVPPLSVLTAATCFFAALTTLLHAKGPRRLAAFALAGQIVYVITGLVLVRAPASIYAALLRSPVYVLWKVRIYVLAAARLRDNRWIRTVRGGEEA